MEMDVTARDRCDVDGPVGRHIDLRVITAVVDGGANRRRRTRARADPVRAVILRARKVDRARRVIPDGVNVAVMGARGIRVTGGPLLVVTRALMDHLRRAPRLAAVGRLVDYDTD